MDFGSKSESNDFARRTHFSCTYAETKPLVVFLWWCLRGGVFAVVFAWWCFCGGVFVVVFLWWCFCGGVFVVVSVWWCFCGGVFVVVFLWWCFCGGVFVVVFLWWCFCGGAFLWWCFCGGVFSWCFRGGHWSENFSAEVAPKHFFQHTTPNSLKEMFCTKRARNNTVLRLWHKSECYTVLGSCEHRRSVFATQTSVSIRHNTDIANLPLSIWLVDIGGCHRCTKLQTGETWTEFGWPTRDSSVLLSPSIAVQIIQRVNQIRDLMWFEFFLATFAIQSFWETNNWWMIWRFATFWKKD